MSSEQTPLLNEPPIDPSVAAGSIQSSEIASKPAGNAGVPGATFNLANTVVGAGVLALPYAFKCTGLGAGIAVLLTIMLLSNYGLLCLAKCCKQTNASSYFEVANTIWSKNTAKFVQAFIMFYTMGSCIAYPVLLGSFIPSIFRAQSPDSILANRTEVILIVAALVLIPMSMIRDLNKLRFTSFLSLIFVTMAVGVNMYRLYEDEEDDKLADDTDLTIDLGTDFAMAFPLISVSFVSHYSAMPIFQSLRDFRYPKMRRVAFGSSIFCCLLFGSMGVAGYLVFGDEVHGNILSNYADDNPLAMASRFGLSWTLILSYPLAVAATRRSLNTIFFGGRAVSFPRHALMTLFIILPAITVAILFEKIEILFAFNGSLFGCPAVYIIPGLMWNRLKPKGTSGFMPKFLVFFGITAAIMGLGTTIYGLIWGHD